LSRNLWSGGNATSAPLALAIDPRSPRALLAGAARPGSRPALERYPQYARSARGASPRARRSRAPV